MQDLTLVSVFDPSFRVQGITSSCHVISEDLDAPADRVEKFQDFVGVCPVRANVRLQRFEIPSGGTFHDPQCLNSMACAAFGAGPVE